MFINRNGGNDMTSKRAATMKDVAKQAGVALGTVSKVINGIPVSEKTESRSRTPSRSFIMR